MCMFNIMEFQFQTEYTNLDKNHKRKTETVEYS